MISSQKGGRKIRSDNLESGGHILEETRRIQNLEQFMST